MARPSLRVRSRLRRTGRAGLAVISHRMCLATAMVPAAGQTRPRSGRQDLSPRREPWDCRADMPGSPGGATERPFFRPFHGLRPPSRPVPTAHAVGYSSTVPPGLAHAKHILLPSWKPVPPGPVPSARHLPPIHLTQDRAKTGSDTRRFYTILHQKLARTRKRSRDLTTKTPPSLKLRRGKQRAPSDTKMKERNRRRFRR